MTDPKKEGQLSEEEIRSGELDHEGGAEAPEAGETEALDAEDVQPEEAETPDAAVEPEHGEDAEEFAPEPAEEAEEAPAAEVESFDPQENFAPEPAPRSGGGKLLAAGAVTAALGFGGGWFTQQQGKGELAAQLAAQEAQIAALAEKVRGIEIPDLGPVAERIGGVETALAAQEAGLADLGAATDQRIADLRAQLAETELVATGGQADASSAGAYVREVEARLAQLEATANRVTEASDALRAEAAAAEAAARVAEARASLSEIDVALTSGAGFAPALGALGKAVEIPAALRDVAEGGVVPLASLRADWPGLARAALAASRDGEASEEGSNLGSLFAKQFNLRSTQPREGDDPDAVLSRAEAALDGGDLAGALAEIGALPEPAQEALAEWTGAARLTEAARRAVADLTQQLNEK